MITNRSLADFCRYILDIGEVRYPVTPCVWERFSENMPDLQRTPTLLRTFDLVQSLGMKIGPYTI